MASSKTDSTTNKNSLNVHEEELEVSKKTVETGSVIIHKTVHTETVITEVPLIRQKVSTVRVPMDKEVAEVPEIRYEGDLIIIPVVKEVPVVTTRLILVEEVHITKENYEITEKIESTLRSEQVEIERKGSNEV